MKFITDCIYYQDKKNHLNDYVAFSVTVTEEGKQTVATPLEYYESPYKDIPEGNACDCKQVYDAFIESGAKEIELSMSENYILLKSRREKEA